MTSPQGNPARREPLLWLQLLGVAAFPLDVAALLLVLAGADPGPLPGVERLFCWALGAVAPALLFWRLPPDLWSLLLLQVPLRGRRSDQLRLSALQTALPLKLLSATGAALLLPLLWWCDGHAGLAWAWSPLGDSPRLVVLLVAASLLALMLWQWQQMVQSLWLFSRPAALVAQTLPLSSAEAGERRLNLGLPLLLLDPIAGAPTPAPSNRAAAEEPVAPCPTEPAGPIEATGSTGTTGSDNPDNRPPGEAGPESTTGTAASAAATTMAAPSHQSEAAADGSETTGSEVIGSAADNGTTSEARPLATSSAEVGLVAGDAAIPPEQTAEQSEGDHLNQQI